MSFLWLHAARVCYSSLRCTGFSLRWLLLLWRMGSRVWASGVVVLGLVAPRHVESSWTRDGNCVHCVGKWVLFHFVTRDVPESYSDISFLQITLKWFPLWCFLFFCLAVKMKNTFFFFNIITLYVCSSNRCIYHLLSFNRRHRDAEELLLLMN